MEYIFEAFWELEEEAGQNFHKQDASFAYITMRYSTMIFFDRRRNFLCDWYLIWEKNTATTSLFLFACLFNLIVIVGIVYDISCVQTREKNLRVFLFSECIWEYTSINAKNAGCNKFYYYSWFHFILDVNSFLVFVYRNIHKSMLRFSDMLSCERN